MLMRIRLADPKHRVPLPGQPGRFLAGDGSITVNSLHPLWAEMLRDGSIVAAPDGMPPPAKNTPKKEAR